MPSAPPAPAHPDHPGPSAPDPRPAPPPPRGVAPRWPERRGRNRRRSPGRPRELGWTPGGGWLHKKQQEAGDRRQATGDGSRGSEFDRSPVACSLSPVSCCFWLSLHQLLVIPLHLILVGLRRLLLLHRVQDV